METNGLFFTLVLISGMALVFWSMFKITRFAFPINLAITSGCLGILFALDSNFLSRAEAGLYIGCPLLFLNVVLYVFLQKEIINKDNKYQVHFKVERGNFIIENIKRGASIIGSAGSGKTERQLVQYSS